MMCNIFYSSKNNSTPLVFQSLTDVQVGVNKTIHQASIRTFGVFGLLTMENLLCFLKTTNPEIVISIITLKKSLILR